MTTISRPIPRAFGAVGNLLRTRPLAGFAVALAALLVLVGVVTTAYAALHADSAFAGVSVAGVPIGDLDRPTAEARLRAVLPAVDQGSLTVRVDGDQVKASFSELGRDYAMASMLDRAFAIGRGGNVLENAADQLRVLTGGANVEAEVTWNEDRLLAFLNDLVAEASTQPANAAIVRDSSNAYLATPAQTGRVIDLAALRARVVAALALRAGGDVTIDAAATSVEPAIATSVAQDAVNRFNAATGDITASGGGVSTIARYGPVARLGEPAAECVRDRLGSRRRPRRHNRLLCLVRRSDRSTAG